MKHILWMVVAVIIGASIFIGYRGSGEGEAMMEKKPSNDEMIAAEKSDSEMMNPYGGVILAGASSPLLDFTKADYDKALAEGKTVALYFYAEWCPLCRAEFPVMQEAFNGLTRDDIVGFKVNFKDKDTDADEVALARQWGVAYQHTKVFVIGDKQVLKSPESWDAARYALELAKTF